MTTLLALDASSTSIGWVLWDGSDVSHFGTITLPGARSQRLLLAETAIDSLVTRYQPDRCAIERPAYSSTSMAVQCKVAGVIDLVLARWKIPDADEIASNTAKKALAGSGRADKEQMIHAASARLIGATRYTVRTVRGSLMAVDAITLMPLYSEHTADALGVALAAWDLVEVSEKVAA